MIIRIIKKINLVLNRHQKIRIAELFVLMIIGAFLEMLSVSMVIPFINLITRPDRVMNNRYVQMICGFFHITDYKVFLAVVAFTMAGIFILKNIYLIFQKNIQNRFVFNAQFTVQKRLLHDFIHRPYQFFLDVKTGEVMRMINNDAKQTFSILTSLLSLATELIVSTSLFAALLAVSPGITLAMMGILLGIVALLSGIIKPIMRRAGRRNQETNARMNRWLLQSIHGIKEIKVMRKEKYFEHNFDEEGRVHVDTLRINNVLKMVPKYCIEAAAMSALFFIIGSLVLSGSDLESLVSTLSMIAMAAIRLLPSVNNISSAISDSAFKEPMLDRLLENLDLADKNKKNEKKEVVKAKLPNPFQDKICLDNITYQYPKGDHKVLNKAVLEVRKGMFVGIVGPSGAGKTTAVDILLGLLEPQEGKVLVDNVNIEDDRSDWFKQISYIPQTIFMLDDTIRANVAFGFKEEKIDEEKVWRALEEASLKDFVETLPEGLDTGIGERGMRLSGGQRQRIGIARALYRDPEILFFDEATSALDNETEKAIMESINKLHGKKTMIIVAHRLTTIEHCDMVLQVDNGSITRER